MQIIDYKNFKISKSNYAIFVHHVEHAPYINKWNYF